MRSLDWERAVTRARSGFAGYLGVPESHVALVGSVAEAAATVAASLPGTGGTVVIGDSEFRSNLFPWLALEARGYRIVRVRAGGASRTQSLLAGMDEQTVLVAVSHVLSADGERADLARLRAAADAVGARICADVTHSLGVLGMDLAVSRPDYLAVHGYKWLLCPRGAAWLVTRHYEELRPLMASRRSASDGDYGDDPPGSPVGYRPVISVVDDWWDGRHMAGMLPRLFFEHFFFEHFSDTSFAAVQARVVSWPARSLRTCRAGTALCGRPLGRRPRTRRPGGVRGPGPGFVTGWRDPLDAVGVCQHAGRRRSDLASG